MRKADETKSKPVRGSRKPYLYNTPAQRFQIGKRAAEHGVTSSMRYFAKKYHNFPLKETTT